MQRKLILALAFPLLLPAVVGIALAQIQGSEVYRRTLPSNSRVRVYQGTSLLSETAVSGDTRITVGLGTPQPAPVELTLLSVPAGMGSNAQATGTVALTGPATTPQTVSLLSSVFVLAVPASVVVPSGAREATFPITTGQVGEETEVVVKATLRTVTRLGTVKVLPVVKPPDPPDPEPEPGAGWFVSPEGKSTNAGTRESPWDLESTVNGTRRSVLAGGGPVWFLPGTYRKSPNPEGLGFRVAVGGREANPLVFRAMPGSRVTLDGGWSFFSGSNYTHLRDVDVTVTDLVMGKPPFGTSGSWPDGAPNGGVSFYTSRGCKVINCRIYRNRQGINLWTEAEDAEAYGNTIYDNGWVGTDRAHGHGLYTQNPPGRVKRILDNIFTHTSYSRSWRDGRYGLHGYGERVPVTDITVDGNFGAGSNDAWLLDDGAPTGPSAGHKFNNNGVTGVRVRLGSRPDQPLELRGNTISGELQVSTGPEVTKANNLISPPEARPLSDQVIVRPNKYDAARAHALLIDWTRNGRVVLDASGWIGAAERVRVLEPTDFWGPPLFSGAWPSGGVELPVEGARAVVLMKESPGRSPAAVATLSERVEEAPVSRRLRR